MISISGPVEATLEEVTSDPAIQHIFPKENEEKQQIQKKTIIAIAAGALTVGLSYGIYKNWDSIAKIILPAKPKTLWEKSVEIIFSKKSEETIQFLNKHVKPYTDMLTLSSDTKASIMIFGTGACMVWQSISPALNLPISNTIPPLKSDRGEELIIQLLSLRIIRKTGEFLVSQFPSIVPS